MEDLKFISITENPTNQNDDLVSKYAKLYHTDNLTNGTTSSENVYKMEPHIKVI